MLSASTLTKSPVCESAWSRSCAPPTPHRQYGKSVHLPTDQATNRSKISPPQHHHHNQPTTYSTVNSRPNSTTLLSLESSFFHLSKWPKKMLSKALLQPLITANLSARPARNGAFPILLYRVESRPTANQRANLKPK